jgi:methyl-accepting chemotaxis protein
MTFRRSAPAALIIAVVIVVAGLTFVTHRLFSGLTSSIEQSQFQLMQSILDTALKNAADDALARADIIASLPETRQAVAAKDRERLSSIYSEMFAVQKERRGVDQVQFHVPPAISLLRLHAPRQFGDDLSRFRPIVASVNHERAPRGGLAIAAGGPAIFGVTPVRDMQGNHAGSVEFGLNFGPLLDGLKAAYGLDLTLFVEEKPLRDFATGIDRAILSDQNRVGRFIRFHSTNATLARELATDADVSSVKEPTRYTRQAQGVPYGVLAVPLRDGAGEPLGMVMVSRDFSGSRAAEGRSLVWQICMAIFAIVILAGVVIVVIRGFLLRPLEVIDRHFAALAAGEPAEPIEGREKFCTEMRSLVGHYDRLRERKAEPTS